jgi:hypothetical protein
MHTSRDRVLQEREGRSLVMKYQRRNSKPIAAIMTRWDENKGLLKRATFTQALGTLYLKP